MKKNKSNSKSLTDSSKSSPKEMDLSYFSPLEVKVEGGNFEKAFKIFRSMVQAEKVLSKYKEKQSYEKPSVKKRRKHNEALKRIAELELKQEKIRTGEYEKEKLKKMLKKDKKTKNQNESGNNTGEV